MKQPCYQACARKTDKVTFTTRSDPIVFAIVFNAEEQRSQRREPRDSHQHHFEKRAEFAGGGVRAGNEVEELGSDEC